MRHYRQLTDNEIVRGLQQGDASVYRDYFYEYCNAAYHIYDQKYLLHQKQNLDFMSLAHQYALYLMEKEWKPLSDRSPNVSLKTWMINGFRYTVLDALKWYKKGYGAITFQDYLQSFDISDDLRLQFNAAIMDICDHHINDRYDRLVLVLMLVEGYKAKDVAERLGISPSAVSQRYSRLKEKLVVPYFKQNFDLDFDAKEVMDEHELIYMERESTARYSYMPDMACSEACSESSTSDDIPTIDEYMEQKRTTPEFIQSLAPGEVFVFGSNLRGMHGGGAAYIAYKKFGAKMGQGVGLQGQSYAIPTMQGGVETIRPYVDEFIAFAKEHPELTFLVTRIGCGIAGFTDMEIAPLFAEAHGVENIVLPEGW